MDADQIIREHMTYAQRVAELEAEGLTTSDAQGVADAEQMKGRVFAEDAAHPNDDAVIREHMRKLGQKGGNATGKRIGRPPIGDEKMKKYLVTLDEPTNAKARKIGAGNLSAGVRKAVARYR